MFTVDDSLLSIKCIDICTAVHCIRRSREKAAGLRKAAVPTKDNSCSKGYQDMVVDMVDMVVDQDIIMVVRYGRIWSFAKTGVSCG